MSKIAMRSAGLVSSIVKRLPERFGIQFIHTLRSSLSDVQSWLSGSLPAGLESEVSRPYEQHATTAIAIEIISSDAASVGWELFRKDASGMTDERIDTHPVLDTFARPNPFMFGNQLFTGTYITDLLFGEAFWYFPDLVVGSDVNALARLEATGSGLWLLDPRSVKHEVKDGRLRWYLDRGRGPGDRMTLDPEKLVHFKRFNPYDPFRGLPKMLSIISDVEGDVAAALYNRNFFGKNNGVPTGLIIPGKAGAGLGAALPVDDDQRRDFLRTFNSAHAQKRGVGMLPAGWDWKDLGISQRDMDYRGLREYSRENELALWGVPPFLAGVLDKANYANAREQKEVYWQGTINRFLTRYQAAINFDFFPKVGIDDVLVAPDWDKVKALLENLVEKTEVAIKWHGIGIPKKVINERLDMGWDEDDIPDYEDGYLPLNLVPTSSIGAVFAPAPPAPPPSSNGETEEEGIGLVNVKDAREARRSAQWKNAIIRMRDLELAFERVIRSHMKNIEREAIASLDSLKGWLSTVTKQEEGLSFFDLDEANRTLSRRTRPHHQAALRRGGETIIADLGLAIAFDVEDPLALAILAEMSHKITRINETIEFALRTSLIEGVRLGESINDLRDRVTGVMQASLGRARTIARTETGFAFNGGRNLSMRQAGIKRHEWLTSRDPDVRDAHQVLDGEKRDIGDPFSNGLMFPQDPSGLPGEIINCRCVAVPAGRI